MIRDAPEVFGTEDMFEMCNAGLYPIMVADACLARFWKQVFGNLAVRDDIVLRSDIDIAFAVRKDSPPLKAEFDPFIAANRQGSALGNTLIKRYLVNTSYVRNPTADDEIRRFRGLVKYFKEYASEYDYVANIYKYYIAYQMVEEQAAARRKAREEAAAGTCAGAAADRAAHAPAGHGWRIVALRLPTSRGMPRRGPRPAATKGGTMDKSRNTRWWKALVAACVLALPLGSALAAEAATPAPPGPVAEEWIVWVTPGHEAQFEAAAKAHAAWRKQNGDPHTWNAYQAIVGNDLTHYVYRAEGLQWPDVDTGNAWDAKVGASKHWNEHVNPHVARYEHYFGFTEFAASHWIDADDYTMYSVTLVQVKPGQWRNIRAGFESYAKAATDAKWDRSWSIERSIGGNGGFAIVRPLRNFADMADPVLSFRDMYIKAMGSESTAQATMDKVNEGTGSSETSVYRWRPDLSTPK